MLAHLHCWQADPGRTPWAAPAAGLQTATARRGCGTRRCRAAAAAPAPCRRPGRHQGPAPRRRTPRTVSGGDGWNSFEIFF